MKKTIKVKKAEWGETVTPYVQAGNFLGTVVSGVSDEGSDGDFAGSALSGAASGAAAGSAFGPWGTAIGGAIGAAGGLFGASKRRKALREKRRREEYQKDYAIARANTSSAMADYYSSYNTAMTMKEGGEVDYSPVYLNDGETVVHPDGSVKRIPKKGRKTDSVLSIEPVGSYVFGGVVDPDTNKTYADMAEEIFKPTKGGSNGKYAENARKLNKLNADLLFAKQERTKAEKGVKPKYKNLDIPAAVTGIKIDPEVEDTELTYEKIAPVSVEGDVTLDDIRRYNEEKAMLNLTNAYETAIEGTDEKNKNNKNKFSNFASDLAALTPVAHNFLQGLRKSEYESPEYNINAYPAISQLRNRYNIGRVIRDVNNAANIGYYNVNTTGNTTGAGMAQRVAIANNARRGIEDAYAKYNEIDTNLGAKRSELLANLGQQDASARTYANDLNVRNRAARRSFMTAAAEGISKWGQNRALMANQRERDLSILPYLRDFLAHGSTNTYNG